MKFQKNISNKISLVRKTFVEKILPNLISKYNKNKCCIQTKENNFCATMQITRKQKDLQTETMERVL